MKDSLLLGLPVANSALPFLNFTLICVNEKNPRNNADFSSRLEWPFGSFLLNIWPCNDLFGLYGLEKKKDGTMNLNNA